MSFLQEILGSPKERSTKSSRKTDRSVRHGTAIDFGGDTSILMTAEDSKRLAKELPELPIDFLGSGSSVKKQSKKKSSSSKKAKHHDEDKKHKKHHKKHHHEEKEEKETKKHHHREEKKEHKTKKSSKSQHKDKKVEKKTKTAVASRVSTRPHPQRSSSKAPSSANVKGEVSALKIMKQLAVQNKKGLVGLKLCSGCHEPEAFCCCTRGGNDYADDGFSCCASHHVYYSKYGYTPFDTSPVSFVLSAAEDGLVRLSPASGFLIADVNTQFGFDEDTEEGATVAVAGLLAPNTSFNRVYFIEEVGSGFYLLQPLNILDADCLTPITGDKWQIMNGPSALMYTIASIDDCDLNWELDEDLLQAVIKVHRAYIACCDDNDC